MNGHIYHQLMLTGAGNHFLRGGDVSGFWPNADAYRFDKSCEFRTPPQTGEAKDDFPLVAADPLAWFAGLKAYAVGLRLIHVKRARGPDQQLEVADRMLAGMVGGGARWLVEVVGKDQCEFWEGFERVGDQKDPERKIWLWTNICIGGCSRQEADTDVSPLTLEGAVALLRAALVEIEAYARQEKYDNFADIFREAIGGLDSDGSDRSTAWPEANYADFDRRQMQVLSSMGHASVFGGMGSWNDLGGGETYDKVSETLYMTLNDCAVALANSTFPG